MRPPYDVGAIFRLFGSAYRKAKKLSFDQLKAMLSIENCRTEIMGRHVDECRECGHLEISYNSCRDRHCPKCQGLAREKWLEAREKDLLPVNYFHIVFTLPSELNPLVFVNKKILFNLFFRTAAKTLVELAADPKLLGAEIGFISILHTWGQKLLFHPHLHILVPGGGLAPNGEWIGSKEKFFLPVKVISRLFRGKFLDGLKKLYIKGDLMLVGQAEKFKNEKTFKSLLDILYRKEWVVYSKPPFASPLVVLKYLSSYVHRVAIANKRILKVLNGKVTFLYRDYSKKGKQKKITLKAEEFIRRFLLHILPAGFMKIRYYGIMSSCNRKTKLQLCKDLLQDQAEEEPMEDEQPNEEGQLSEIEVEEEKLCPKCKKGRMFTIERNFPPNKYELIEKTA